MGRLEGKSTIVTGAASGIGAATAARFVAEGARVLLADIQDGKGERLAADLGPRARYQHADVTDAGEVSALVDRAVAEFGRLDCMFNNAGAPGVSDSILEVDVEGFDRTVALLLRSVFLGMKYAGKAMVDQGEGGSIISTASVAGLRGGFGPHIYTAAKSGVINLTRSVGQELGEKHIRVNCICPGGIATPIFGIGMDLPSQLADASAEKVKPFLAMAQSTPRAGLPEDIANAALYLASDEASFVNGHALVVDGGLTSGGKFSDSRARAELMRQALAGDTD